VSKRKQSKRDRAARVFYENTTPEYRKQLLDEKDIFTRCGFADDELMLIIDENPGRQEDRFQYVPCKAGDVWP
jgi:hypothetical protein